MRALYVQGCSGRRPLIVQWFNPRCGCQGRRHYRMESLVIDMKALVKALGYHEAVRRRRKGRHRLQPGRVSRSMLHPLHAVVCALRKLPPAKPISALVGDPPDPVLRCVLAVFVVLSRCWWAMTGAATWRGTWRTPTPTWSRRW